jgi:regulator of sigma E protease
MTSILSALVVLGILIFIHELGHFLTARACGVGVKVFSLGFGKKIFGFVKGNTEYKISLIPLGGYVRMVGEGPEDEVDISEKNLSFSEKPVWQRLLIVGSGPGANFLLAVFIYALILMTWGLPVLMPGIGQVLKGYPAEIAGLKKGDLILEVKEQEVKTWDQMADIIKSHGNNPLPLKIRRDDQILNLTLTPSTGKAKNIYGQDITKPMIGISPSGQTFSRKLGFFESITGGIAQTWEVAELTFMTVIKLIKREVPLSSIG